ncbi:MAG: DUF2785 domain-containing protein [Treponema sp.]|nr:DUF2785 domain-containing protein [Treponema sp.]
MRSEAELKALLAQMQDDACAPPSDTQELDVLVADLLAHIGSTDAQLRDDLIYGMFIRLFIETHLSEDQARHIFNAAIGERHLLYKIGEVDTDSVFTRSFSALIIPIAFEMNQKKAFLSTADIMRAKDAALRYLREENDLRGFVPGKGWAHSVAHCADALAYLAESPALAQDDLAQILDAIKNAVQRPGLVYLYEEDERLTNAFMQAYERGLLPDAHIIEWLRALKSSGAQDEQQPNAMFAQVNRKNFLRCIYFKLSRKGCAPEIMECLKALCEWEWPPGEGAPQ